MSRRVLLVDDEAPARQRMRRLLAAHDDELEIVGEAGDGVSALEAIERLRPDIVLLDIDMPELDGLGVAAALPSELADRPAVIFVTAYDEHALRAFELAAVDYLVKPVSAERLAAALGKVRAPLPAESLAGLLAAVPASAPRRLAVRSGAKYLVFDPARVSAVLAADHYATLVVDDRELLIDEGLDALARRLGGEFLRVHRSAVINVAFLKELVGQGDRRYVAVLADAKQTRVPVSRDRLAQLKAVLGLTG